MKINSNSILEILRIFFWIFTVLLCLGLSLLVFIFFSTILGIDIGSMKEMKIDVNLLHGKIKDIQSLGKTKLLFLLAYSITAGGLYLFFFITVIKVLKRLQLNLPFSMEIYFLISKIAKLALLIGSLSFLMSFITELITGEFSVSLDLGNENFQFFLLAAVVYVIAQVYKRAVDLQSENDLTI